MERWAKPIAISLMSVRVRDGGQLFQKHTTVTWHTPLGACRQMVSYRELATEDAQKCLRRLLEAEAKPLIVDLLCAKRGEFTYVSRDIQVVLS